MNRITSALNLFTRAFTSCQTNSTVNLLGSIQRSVFGQLDSLQIRGAKYGREYQPNNLQRKRKHGYLKRMRTAAGRKIIEARKAKGRKWLSH